MFKVSVCLALLAVAVVCAKIRDNEVHNYEYRYTVKDQLTHDRKSHWEAGEGGRVRGSYKLVDPDGAIRTVNYVADGENGFNAVVTREKHGQRHVTYHGKRDETGRNRNGGYYQGRAFANGL